jgi:hypothetical protein
MKTKYGVSSVTPMDKKLKNGYTMYDWVKRQNCFPDFCMRTLSGENKITMEEVGNLSGSFNYELSCRFTRRVKRIYVNEDTSCE